MIQLLLDSLLTSEQPYLVRLFPIHSFIHSFIYPITCQALSWVLECTVVNKADKLPALMEPALE